MLLFPTKGFLNENTFLAYFVFCGTCTISSVLSCELIQNFWSPFDTSGVFQYAKTDIPP